MLSNSVSAGQLITQRWSCGNTKRIKRGDRLFLIALGKSKEVNKGIFASGIALQDSFQEPHWDNEQRALGKTSQFTVILFDTLINPFKDVGIPRALLNTPPFLGVNWSTQSSGILIPEDVAQELEKQWMSVTKRFEKVLPLTVADETTYYEGASHQLTLTQFERNPQARLRCIQYYGTACVICDFDFGQTYGDLGAGFIHVHHIIPLNEIREGYFVDPIRDLRPVCPNCHAMIHRRNPPFIIDEIRSLLSSKRV
jgi:5-methylcytosine-specific restriction enzyme A